MLTLLGLHRSLSQKRAIKRPIEFADNLLSRTKQPRKNEDQPINPSPKEFLSMQDGQSKNPRAPPAHKSRVL
ncbi:uncharacterized protein B0I36DRAFT_310919 [Microdochium trichocladiopsis]|uniref:Uncharacterized protein n=1 Tax=Microdochium trichocladiopsis TaxID=1682393 RepID=A0A9P8YHL2_9PEZI|nr:uncharacterized protein B0I36DRAFT_310919 [Microdochium trichocladiopsis]KAH7040534.1 hypothetical protein B0I36DRAFT_310919 [Microdochium trichocladiopsis]